MNTNPPNLWPPGAHELRKIFFREMVVELPIGVHASEIGRRQRIAVNIELFLEPPAAAHGDDIANVFDYDQIRRGIRTMTKGEHINLQETLVERIVELCLSYDQVRATRVSTAKLDVYPDVAAVGVEITRVKDSGAPQG